ncbi:MAG: UDP-N-acetylmuramoyl-tripeptide--D-alanyl-D-alanine ligase [Hydrogenophaga sp.]|uniref:UDP-N-acetylmuramoyl-tripeptide--D-alanyl-D- alanine ligase n=1 Tax=Hydrogenophaga sp. TaxID=1904254 RepID=UPI00257A4DCB|nr:UDP-N-acetylmuramoyl-tripeptide--D-alanyl-D-alanine ligase [Hydrogenophaga sp.]MBL0945623.1 UDP-N-acetylmuramoyl-tripeptide--D-alanyl-D-alanine ligase [Hydrogenophaga sp.]
MKTIAELMLALPGARAVGALSAPVQRVHTDTRSLQAGDLFVALRGERFDAHAFLPQAAAAGAVGAIAHAGLAEAGLAGVEVPDTLAALQLLAQAWRAQFTLPLIAVAGSNGKTTVTQMVASILRAHAGDASHATQGNFNNHIGVPLTLLRLGPQHRCSVVELGMNHPGEIALLAAVAAPTVALVNNAQREHQEFMATVDAVARENGAAIEALRADGTAVFPSDDAHTAIWRELAGARRVIAFSDTDPGAEVRATSARWLGEAWALHLATPAGETELTLRIAGQHNVRNALAATACALAAGVPLDAIRRGLEAFEPVGGRSRAIALQVGGRVVTLVDDSYNANPDSVRAAIEVLATLPGPHLLVLGDMGEVGDQALAFHLEVLRHAYARGIDEVRVSGEHMRAAVDALQAAGESAPQHVADVAALASDVAAEVATGAVGSVLVKGSRFMRMERVVQAVRALDPTQNNPDKDHPHAA